MKTLKDSKTSFVKVRCNKCKNEQNVYSTVTSKVNCLVCGELMVEPTGGRGKFAAKVLEVLP